MVLNVDVLKLCTGCTACQMKCPKQCITMEKDTLGFVYPTIDYEKCIKCGMCTKICPVVNKKVKKNKEKKVFASWSKDPENRWESTSGGLFYEICKALGKVYDDLYVCAAEYDDGNNIVHNIYHNEIDIKKFRQSKYAQSDMNNCFVRIEKLLNGKKTVLFCGTPCQVEGLKQYLGKTYERLITIDFICRGVNSPKAYKKWIEEIEQSEGEKIKRIWFKYKKNGWKKSPMCTMIELNNGKKRILEGKKNYYMRGYLGPNLYIRSSCANCLFKGVDRVSDITLGDFWGIDQEMDDNGGTSLVMANTHIGLEVIEMIKDYVFIYEKKIDDIVGGNVCFKDSVKINPQSSKFLTELDVIPFSKCVKKYTHKSVLTIINEHFMYFVKKLRRIK